MAEERIDIRKWKQPQLVRAVYGALATFITLFAIVTVRDFSIGDTIDALAELLAMAASIATLVYFHWTKNIAAATISLTWIAYLLILALVAANPFDHFTIMYVVIVPIVPFFLFSLRKASLHIGLFYLLLIVTWMVTDIAPDSFIHDPEKMFNLVINILFIFAAGIVYHFAIRNSFARLEASYAQNQILLHEVYHRVNNNLQIILSMVRMQKEDIGEEDIETTLLTIENRINAIAKAYKLLMDTPDYEAIGIGEYLRALTHDIQAGVGREDVALTVDVHGAIPLRESIYIGLILNELLTHVYQHAFGEGGGTITIRLKQEQGRVTLTVEDDGHGSVAKAASESLGWKLVHVLVSGQLRGTLSVKTDETGEQFVIQYPTSYSGER